MAKMWSVEGVPNVLFSFTRIRKQVLYGLQTRPELSTTPGLNIREVLDGKAEPNDELLAVLGLKRVPRT